VQLARRTAEAKGTSSTVKVRRVRRDAGATAA
jgi:hypothetical protein